MTGPSNGHRGTILVTDTTRGSAIAIMRSLGRAGWRVIAADVDARSLGFRSRYAAARVIYPAPADEPAAFLDTLQDGVRDHDVQLIIPVTDECVRVLAEARERFEPACRLAIADDAALRAVNDKAETVRLAESLAVPTPDTRIVRTSVEALEASGEFGWPVVLKAAVSPDVDEATGRLDRRPVTYANTAEQLESALTRYGGRRVLLQRYCPGVGQGVEMLAWCGRIVAAFQHKRLAEVPVCGGASAWRESVALDPELYEYSTRLVDALGWTGLIMVEFKVGDRARLMEINGRVWGSLPLAVLSGMDFPARLAELLLADEPEAVAADAPCTAYRLGVQAYNLELTALWMASVLAGRRRFPFLRYPRRREAVSAALGMLRPRGRFDILSRDDPKPGLAELSKIARKLASKVAGSRSAVTPL